MSEGIKNILARKDDAKVKNAESKLSIAMPGLKKGMSRDDIKFYMETLHSDHAIDTEVSVSCINSCFKDFTVPTVAQRESDCMTNCTLKGLETWVWFKNMKKTKHPDML